MSNPTVAFWLQDMFHDATTQYKATHIAKFQQHNLIHQVMKVVIRNPSLEHEEDTPGLAIASGVDTTLGNAS